MLAVTIIAVGNLKEQYLRDASAEYEKRLSGLCSLRMVEIKETRLPDNPSEGVIRAALEDEGERILSAVPPRAYTVALCVEGKQLDSPGLAAALEQAASQSGSVCFIIGGSFGLSDNVKRSSSLRLSFSRLTFPHQLMRVMLLEAVYRGFNIIKGTKYHK